MSMLFAAKKNNLSPFSPIVMIGMEAGSNKKSSVLLLKRHQTLDLKISLILTDYDEISLKKVLF